MNLPFIKFSKVYHGFSLILAVGAFAAIFGFGLNFGIDFTGGSVLELNFEERPDNAIVGEKLKDLNLGEITFQPLGEKGLVLKAREIDEQTHLQIISKLGEISKVQEVQFENIGPVIGKELRQKTLALTIVSLMALILYIILAFRKIIGFVSGWHYGVVSVLALFFDMLVTVGFLTWLGKSFDVQFNIPIVTALLTILGYTINDKIIVFDRIRENNRRMRADDFSELVNKSLNQTLARSFSTGTCSLLVLAAIFLFGGETLKYFALTLMIGIIVGTYSSLFLAAPVLADWLGRKKGK